jgi:peptidoglycan/LPS O-acetylase OafA/YrhL
VSQSPPPPDSAAVEPDPSMRPGGVVAGCIMCWIGAGFGALLGFALIASAGNADFRDQVGADSDATTTLRLFGSLTVVWCLAVAVLAVLAFSRKRWAAVGLLAMAVVYAVLTLVLAVMNGALNGLVGVAYSVAAVVLILNGSRQWYAAS